MFNKEFKSNTEVLTEAHFHAIVQGIMTRGLQVPAIFVLELHKPLVRLAHTSVLMSAPLLQFLLGTAKLEVLLTILSSPDHIENLIARLESVDKEPA
ncbi:MAG: hypothetical protein KDD62_14440 [Bdellovibrionales bacterium]|nr:hypothetical protein [Bdellovibrionales bacterium]